MSFLRKSPALLLSLLALPGFVPRGPGQEPKQPSPAPHRSGGRVDAEQLFREIDDPASGSRWLLMRSFDHPGAPGNLILIPSDPSSLRANLPQNPPPIPAPMIRAGDALILEEHTTVVDARLEAIALGPARIGAVLRARIKVGGRVVRAVASGPGTATIAENTEQQP